MPAAGVATTAAASNLTVVFHTGGPELERDVTRGIEYVRAPLTVQHVVASAAILSLFPAVHVSDGPGAGWYFDGGTRLNEILSRRSLRAASTTASASPGTRVIDRPRLSGAASAGRRPAG